MSHAHDLTGKRFGRLAVIRENGRSKLGRVLWLCKCDCGNEITLSSNRLLQKEGTKSCGCLRRETSAKKATKHGLSKSPLYQKWLSMMARCTNENGDFYYRYGGRGIKVCDRWKDFKSFYDDMIGTYEIGLSLDRKDNEGNYEPSNCKWSTNQEQTNNYSRNVLVTINGETDTVKNMCRKYNVPYDRTAHRINKGIDTIEAFTAIYRNGTNQITGHEQLK